MRAMRVTKTSDDAPWKDIDPGVIEYERHRRERRDQPAQVPLYDQVPPDWWIEEQRRKQEKKDRDGGRGVEIIDYNDDGPGGDNHSITISMI